MVFKIIAWGKLKKTVARTNCSRPTVPFLDAQDCTKRVYTIHGVPECPQQLFFLIKATLFEIVSKEKRPHNSTDNSTSTFYMYRQLYSFLYDKSTNTSFVI